MRRRQFKLIGLLTAISAATGGWILSPLANAAEDALDKIKARGKMIVAIDPTFAPFEFTDEAGKITGFDPAVLEAIAKNLGVQIEYQKMGFSGIIPGLVAGSFDFSVSALNVTAERAKKIDYTIPLAASVNAVLKRAGDANVKNSKPEDLAGLKLAVKATTQPEQMMQKVSQELKAKGLKPIEFLSVDTVEQTITALLNNRVDMVVDDLIVLSQAAKTNAGKLEVVGNIGDRALIAWGTNKKDPKLNAYLTEQIMRLKKDGTLAKLQKQFLGVSFDDLPEKDFIPSK